MRDSGPIVIYNGKEEKPILILMVGPNIKLPIRQNVPAAVASFKLATNTSDAQGKPVIVEGGAIDSNGRGTLTSEECLMHPDIKFGILALPKI
jgi:agmatine deiminase